MLIKTAREVWADLSPDLLDGIKVRVPEGWFIVRPSNTEPVVRLYGASAFFLIQASLPIKSQSLSRCTANPNPTSYGSSVLSISCP